MTGASDEAATPLSTHSLKATVLSWACKDGSLDLSERLILGHHLDRPSTSALCYGRANCAEPLRKIHRMLKRMATGQFFPDARPSALITRELAQLDIQTEEFERAMGAEGEASDGSAGSVADDEAAEEQCEDVVPTNERRCVPLPNKDRYCQHVSSGTLHVIVDAHKFACGRPRSGNYTEPASDSVHGAPLCAQCAQAAPL